MRRSVLASVLEVVERNSRLRDRLALFEIGPQFLPVEGQTLPDEAGRRGDLPDRAAPAASLGPAGDGCDGFLRPEGCDRRPARWAAYHRMCIYEPAESYTFHPGKSARDPPGRAPDRRLRRAAPAGQGALRLRPGLRRPDGSPAPVLAADLDLAALLAAVPAAYEIGAVPTYPPVLEDIAVIVDEDLPAGQVEAAIRQAGGKLLAGVRLFDIFRGEQIGAGKKSLAYSLTYQAPDRTLTDAEAAQVRNRIIRQVEKDLGAKLRSSA